MSLDLQSLIEKLNPVCRKGLETAAEYCVSQTNYNVEIEHLLLKLLDISDTDIHRLFRYYDIRSADVNKELTLSVDKFKRGNSRTPTLSPHILQLLEQAWLLSSLQLRSKVTRSGAVLLSLLTHDTLRGVAVESAPALKGIPGEAIQKEIGEIIRFSSEEAMADISVPETKKAGRPTATSQPAPSQTPALDQYTIDLTQRAAAGLIDPIQGRDAEIRQIIDILTRRRQNNPILTGDAGVGKTAVVEGFAIRCAKKDVPPALENISLRLLDLALLQAGAGIKGEFEKRLKSVIDEVKSATRPIILFIDEAHTMIGAGGPAGGGDAANLLKPALARGELRTIAATTWLEYKKYFEKDPALARRFQVIKVDEPDEDTAVEMLRGVVANLEKHHHVTVLDEAVWDAVRLSHRYISGRQLPDKAISVLDTACARVAIGQNSTPPEIEDFNRRVEQLELEITILQRESASGLEHADRIEELSKELKEIAKIKQTLESQWQKELQTVKKILTLEENINTLASEEKKGKTKNLKRLKAELLKEKQILATLQGDVPMVATCVSSQIIASVISNWTGIPVGKMLTDEINTVLSLQEKLSQRIVGQDQALSAICRRIQTYRAELDDPGKPVGVFLLVGPSGIGKTESALALADILYGGERNMTAVNMSEYQEAYTVSGLKGSPPGYVGYGKGGILTEPVRHNPYSVVLLDEVEKAHSDVMELFYQVFDKGVMEDAEGITVDFKNTLILLTSNVGTETILKACHDPHKLPDSVTLAKLIRPELLKYFKAALLGRLVIVPYYPLVNGVIRRIVHLKLDKIKQRFRDNHRAELSYSEELVAAIAARCTEVDTGARNVDHILTHILLPELSKELLRRMAVGEICTGIYIYLDKSGEFAYRFEPPLSAANAPLGKPRPTGPLDWSKPHKYPAGSHKDRANGDLLDKVRPHPGGHVRPNIRRTSKKSKRLTDLFKR